MVFLPRFQVRVPLVPVVLVKSMPSKKWKGEQRHDVTRSALHHDSPPLHSRVLYLDGLLLSRPL